MNERYEYEGEPLNRLIVRAILRKCLVDTDVHRAINPQQVSRSTRLTFHQIKLQLSGERQMLSIISAHFHEEIHQEHS